MAHHIYNTEGFVLQGEDIGEANKIYTLFTKDLGLVRALAQGVRLQKSKLRYSLQDFCRVKLSLVRGKEWWRVTNARIEDNVFADLKASKPARKIVAQIFALVSRMLAGEEKNAELYQSIASGIDFLKNEELADDQQK